ncbi:DUF6622 family protein [Hoeflea sp.]|uniref:DUF6622 family protein n=1 Tax=Hoeflea sp. TaxID=1940281 RepID=UPI00374A7DE0
MTLDPLLHAGPAIQIHALAVIPAALIGGYVLWAKKGTWLHRLCGRIWIGLMVVTALSSFLIHEIRLVGDFSPIHILSIVVLVSSFEIVRSARQRNFVRHQRVVKSLYFGAIGIAGLFTLMPGRIMHEVVFGQASAMAGEAPEMAALAGQSAVRQIAVGQIVGGAPVWVWPLLVALIALGASRMRDREMAVWRLMLLPVIMAGLSAFMMVGSQLTGLSLAAAVAALVAGTLAGWWSLRHSSAILLEGNRVRVRGEVVSMIAILVIFVARFASGAVFATDPELAQTPAVSALFVAVPLFCAALMAARALAQAGINPLQRQSRRLTGAADC